MVSPQSNFEDQINQLPLVDEDGEEVSDDESSPGNNETESSTSSGICSPITNSEFLDLNADEAEEKEKLIQQVLELQNTLDDLSIRVDSVKEDNVKLRSENQVLGQYIENLMSASSVFHSTSSKSIVNKRKSQK